MLKGHSRKVYNTQIVDPQIVKGREESLSVVVIQQSDADLNIIQTVPNSWVHTNLCTKSCNISFSLEMLGSASYSILSLVYPDLVGTGKLHSTEWITKGTSIYLYLYLHVNKYKPTSRKIQFGVIQIKIQVSFYLIWICPCTPLIRKADVHLSITSADITVFSSSAALSHWFLLPKSVYWFLLLLLHAFSVSLIHLFFQ